MNYTIHINTNINNNYTLNINCQSKKIAIQSAINIIHLEHEDLSEITSLFCYMDDSKESDYDAKTEIVYTDEDGNYDLSEDIKDDSFLGSFLLNEI